MQPIEFTYHKLDENAIENIKTLLNQTDWSPLFQLNIDNQYDFLTETLNGYINKMGKLVTVKIPAKRIIREKWITPVLLKASSKLSNLRRRTHGKSKENPIHDKFKSKRNEYNRALRLAKKTYYEQLFEQCKNDIKATWKAYFQITG